MLTAFDVHFGRAEQLREMRADVLDAVYAKHPERFVRKAPGPQKLLEAAGSTSPAIPGRTIKRFRHRDRPNYLP
jgi:putative transposase